VGGLRRGSVLSFYNHTTKYSRGHKTCKNDQNPGAGWRLVSKTLAGKELLRRDTTL